jgi:hypothetical protein
LEAEIVTLRKDLQNKNMQKKSKVLDDIISSQKFHHDKSKLRYNQTEKGSTPKKKNEKYTQKVNVEKIKENKKTYKEDYRDTPPSRRFIF